MPTFPSSEWIDAFCDELARHPRAPDAARQLNGVYRFVIDPAGPLVDRHEYQIELSAVDGGARVSRVDDTRSPRVAVRTDYARWQQLLRGQLDLGPAVLFGRVRISGDLGTLLESRDEVGVIVDALQGVDTVWIEHQA